MSQTDRIEKKVLVRAPRAKLWKALTDTELLGKWFSARIERAWTASCTSEPVAISSTSAGTVAPSLAASART